MTRLPSIGGDDGDWGEILNDFLVQAHNTDGSLKNVGLIASKYTKPAGGIPKTDLHADVQASLDNADAAVAGSAPDASPTTKGILRLSGDLTGDALAPLIAPGKVTGGIGGSVASGTLIDDNIHASANIAKSKLAPLALIDNDIAVGAAIVQSKIQNLTSDLASKAALVHTHAISDVVNLYDALDAKAASVHTHPIAQVTGLQAALDGKAATNHTHTADAITDFTAATAAVIGDRVQAGTNVTVDYDAGTGVTTINSTGGGGTGTPSDSVLSVAGRTGDVVLAAGDIVSGTFSTSRIPNLDTGKLTSGTLDIARIPTGTSAATVAVGNHNHTGVYAPVSHTHGAADINTGTLDIARIPTGTSAATVAVGNHNHDSTYAALVHNHDDRYYTETEMDAALANKLNASEKGNTNGVATLGSDGKIPASQLPAIAIKDTFTVASQAAMLALGAQRGDMAIRTDNGTTYVLASDSPTTLTDWKQITSGTAPVTSVNGKTGAVTIAAADVGLGNVENTADVDKPISSVTQTALNGKVADSSSGGGTFWGLLAEGAEPTPPDDGRIHWGFMTAEIVIWDQSAAEWIPLSANTVTAGAVTAGVVSATVSGTSVALSGTMTAHQSFDELNISVASAGSWVVSTDQRIPATVDGTVTLSGTVDLSPGTYNAYLSWSTDGQVSYTTGPQTEFTVATGGSGGSGGSGSPDTEIAMYDTVWSVNNFDTSVYPAANEVRLSFVNHISATDTSANLELVGYGTGGKADMIAQLAAWRGAGKKVLLSLGGGGYQIDLSDTTRRADEIRAVISDLSGNVDGIDFDIESSSLVQAQAVGLVQNLKATQGSNFMVTMAPNGSNVDEYLPVALALHNIGALDSFGQQFYDAPVSQSDVQSRISQYVGYGLPISKYAIGMQIGSGSNFWTRAECQSIMTWAKSSYGITKCYYWYGQNGSAGAWASDMSGILAG